MLNDAKITFRCKYGKKALFTPQYAHDVEAMRKHPDYEELDASGEAVPLPPEGANRPLISVDSTRTLAPSTKPKTKRK